MVVRRSQATNRNRSTHKLVRRRLVLQQSWDRKFLALFSLVSYERAMEGGGTDLDPELLRESNGRKHGQTAVCSGGNDVLPLGIIDRSRPLLQRPREELVEALVLGWVGFGKIGEVDGVGFDELEDVGEGSDGRVVLLSRCDGLLLEVLLALVSASLQD